jgi:glutamyl-tRNA synthetase
MSAEAAPRLEAALEALRTTEPFDPTTLERELAAVVERLQVKPKDVYQPLRVAITGTSVSPGIFDSLAALGRDESLARVESALARMGSMGARP